MSAYEFCTRPRSYSYLFTMFRFLRYQDFGIRNIRSQDYSFPGTFVPMVELSFSGPFVPWNIRSLDRSFHGTFVPWNFRSRYPGPGAAEGKEKWGSNTHPWRAREREPIMGVWERSPSGGPGGRAPGGGQRAKPPAAEEVFVFKMVIFNAYATVLHEMMYCLSCFFCKVSK